MPAYNYQCVDCRTEDTRIGGADDHVAVCHGCGGMMLRVDEDLFGPYFEAQEVECGQAAPLG